MTNFIHTKVLQMKNFDPFVLGTEFLLSLKNKMLEQSMLIQNADISAYIILVKIYITFRLKI